jgi:hypothetical protein
MLYLAKVCLILAEKMGAVPLQVCVGQETSALHQLLKRMNVLGCRGSDTFVVFSDANNLNRIWLVERERNSCKMLGKIRLMKRNVNMISSEPG